MASEAWLEDNSQRFERRHVGFGGGADEANVILNPAEDIRTVGLRSGGRPCLNRHAAPADC